MNDASHRQADACRSPGDYRTWLLTWTTYGTWLPGDPRGFVSEERRTDGTKRLENRPQTPYRADSPSLENATKGLMSAPRARLDLSLACRLFAQLQETAVYRGWRLLAAAVMTTHVHLIVEVAGDPPPDSILRDLKSYGSRALSVATGEKRRWWTQSGSKRKLPDDRAVTAAVEYVKKQPSPLLVWTAP